LFERGREFERGLRPLSLRTPPEYQRRELLRGVKPLFFSFALSECGEGG